MRNSDNGGRIVTDGISGWVKFIPDSPAAHRFDVVDLWVLLRTVFTAHSSYEILMDADRGRFVQVITGDQSFTVRRCGDQYSVREGGDQNAR